MTNCIIVDDEPLARQLIAGYIEQVPGFNLVGCYASAIEAFAALHCLMVDVMFLDIEMPGINGINFVKSLKPDPKVVFITAHAEFAVQAFELEAVDYLVKPVTFERFLKASQKIIKAPDNGNIQKAVPENTSIFLKVDRRLVKIDLSDILHIQAMGDYLKVHVPGKSYVSYMTLAKVESLLPVPKFARIHRSTIINTAAIEYIEGNFVVINGLELTIGPSYREELMKGMSNIEK